MAGDILGRIRSAEKLPSLPKVVIDILVITRDPKTSAEHIAAALQNDPALTAKVLRIVNSAMFSTSHEVTSIRQAVALLGMRSIRALAMSFALIDLMAGRTGDLIDFPRFWRRSLTTAVTARLFALELDAECADDAFVAGLLCNVGMLAACSCAADLVSESLKESDGKLTIGDVESERRVFGADRAQMASALLHAWSLPEWMCDAIGGFLGDGLDELSEESRRLARALQSADALASIFIGERPETDLQTVIAETEMRIAIPEGRIHEILGLVDDAVRESADVLAINVGETMSYDTLREQAVSQLATLAVQAELELQESQHREQEAHRRVVKLQQENYSILEAASTDALTQIPNRAAFDQRFREELRRAHSTRHPLSLILVDLDHFKEVNDSHGHRCGDAVLREVANRIDSATAASGFAARYGGEEFAIIAPSLPPEGARAAADEVRRIIGATPIEVEGVNLHVTASLGVATATLAKNSITTDELFELADRCLYQAKAGGRNRIELAVMDECAQRRESA